MSYYDHATMIAYRLGPFAPTPGSSLDVPSSNRSKPAAVTAPCSTTTWLRRKPIRAWFTGLRDRFRPRAMPQGRQDRWHR
ncbi:hypothetical protein SAMN05877838_1757 [Hoeflea halophila]|uniref:Uncharacterized protein n=1 Tax=Hoeflea halophila TaxID=714899 RepID=A0A286I9Y6_9HYPH|nr:hypothetical protein [Hoeflea halophila]SOE16872.1 hypothetical protein SAMN05877838_1757 [Hoeflea halophila]